MYISIIPLVENTKVINKNIIYFDMITETNNQNKNLELTTISNISEYSLENCIKIILENNHDTIFYKIEYSRINNKVNFYTNKKITIDKWIEKNRKKYHPITTIKEILEEINKLLNTNIEKDLDCISLYDIYILLNKTEKRLEDYKKYYEKVMNNKLKEKYPNTSVEIYDYNYQNDELTIGFKYKNNNYDKIIIKKENNNIYISKSENNIFDSNILNLLYLELIGICNKMIYFYAFKNDYKYKISSINSNFLININSKGVGITTETDNFSLFLSNNSFEYNYNSIEIIEAIKEKETALLKNILIKIDDCPKWSRLELYDMRKMYIMKELIQEKEVKKRELQKEKRLKLTRKILPFIKL